MVAVVIVVRVYLYLSHSYLKNNNNYDDSANTCLNNLPNRNASQIIITLISQFQNLLTVTGQLYLRRFVLIYYDTRFRVFSNFVFLAIHSFFTIHILYTQYLHFFHPSFLPALVPFSFLSFFHFFLQWVVIISYEQKSSLDTQIIIIQSTGTQSAGLSQVRITPQILAHGDHLKINRT